MCSSDLDVVVGGDETDGTILVGEVKGPRDIASRSLKRQFGGGGSGPPDRVGAVQRYPLSLTGSCGTQLRTHKSGYEWKHVSEFLSGLRIPVGGENGPVVAGRHGAFGDHEPGAMQFPPLKLDAEDEPAGLEARTRYFAHDVEFVAYVHVVVTSRALLDQSTVFSFFQPEDVRWSIV